MSFVVQPWFRLLTERDDEEEDDEEGDDEDGDDEDGDSEIPAGGRGGETAPAASSSTDPALSSPWSAPASCRKKKSEVNEGYIKDMISHMDEFVHASFDEHKSCLQKTFRKFMGTSKAAQTSTPAPSAMSDSN